MNADYFPAGDRALVVKLGGEISPDLNDRVHALADSLDQDPLFGVTEWTPSYSELLIEYDPAQIRQEDLIPRLEARIRRSVRTAALSATTFVVPVLYGGEAGPDLEDLARLTGLSTEEIIRRHSAPRYRIYMLGFTPGFCYLGGLDPSLATPRRQEPRLRIPSGSVGIADRQTGIYPIESPGGWQLIGRTPLSLFTPQHAPYFLFTAGSHLRFTPVCEEEYSRIREEVQNGSFAPSKEEGEPS